MADPNVHPRLRGVVGLDTVDLPAAVQLLADIVSSYIPCYDGDEDRAAEWADTDLAAGGASDIDYSASSGIFKTPTALQLLHRTCVLLRSLTHVLHHAWPHDLGGTTTFLSTAGAFLSAFNWS